MADLRDRTALVTGASRGIGRAIAERLASDGARVAVHYATNEDAAKATLESIEQAEGLAFPIRAELGTTDGLDALFSALEAGLAGAPLDILVNNAAIMSTGREKIDPAEFDRLFAVNVKAPFFVIQRALPLLADGGRVINISSAATRIAVRDFAYAMTKGALDAMGLVLANVLGERGITVNTVAPGLTSTDMNGWLEDPAVVAAISGVTALGRVGCPSDIADAVSFLASKDAHWITGHVLDVTGGLWLGPRGEGNPWLSLVRP